MRTLSLPAVTVGAGLQSSVYDCDKGCINSPGTIPPGDSNVDVFALNSIRLYVNGVVTDQIKFTFNTEYTGSGTNTVGVLSSHRSSVSARFNCSASTARRPMTRRRS